MNGGLVDSATQIDAPDDRRIYGVARARVIANCDRTNLGRVQVRLPWLPGYEPWARLASTDQGTYFIPKVDDEVLVVFNNGDVSEPYVIGQVWNKDKRPPAEEEGDPVNKRIIRTPKKHEIVFDDQAKSIAITSADGHQIKISPSEIKITMAEDKGSLTLNKSGDITVKASSSVTIDAPTINLQGDNIAISGSKSARIDGGSYSSIQASKIYIG
jgi:phage baseplate assembly protein V